MSNSRALGIVLVLVGGVGTVIAALADPLGIGEGHTFGWLQILGTILGALVLLLGLAIVAEWVPVPGPNAGTAAGTTPAPQTAVVTDSSQAPRTTDAAATGTDTPQTTV